MPFCQDESCKKTGLRKHEVEFDDELQKVLCRPCYRKRHEPIPVLLSAEVAAAELAARQAPKVTGGVHFTAEDGLMGDLHYGGLHVNVQVDIDEFKKLFE